MHVINTDGLALIGPGSEWFWTALQFLALAVTGFVIFRQLRAQAWATSMTMAIRLADDFRIELLRSKLIALMDVTRNRQVMTPAIERVGGWFDGTSEDVDQGYIPAAIARQQWGEIGQTFWAVFRPVVEERRKTEPDLWKAWERWVDDVVIEDRKAGLIRVFSDAYLARWIPEAIAFYLDALRLREEEKRGVIPVWPAVEPSEAPQDDRGSSGTPDIRSEPRAD